MATTQNAVNGRSGTIINKVRTTSFTQTSTAAYISTTSTTLTTAGMTLLCSLTITPESSSNILVFSFFGSFCGYHQSNYDLYIALFQGTTLLSSCFTLNQGQVNTGAIMNCCFLYQQAAGTTSSTTYSIYYAGGTIFSDVYVNITDPTVSGSLGSSLSNTFTIAEEIA